MWRTPLCPKSRLGAPSCTSEMTYRDYGQGEE
jgi:hypothetical protein